VENWEQDHSFLRVVLQNCLHFHVLYEDKPQWEHNLSCAKAREKQTNKEQKQTQSKWSVSLLQVLLLLCADPSCLIQPWSCCKWHRICSTQHSSRDCDRSHPTIKLLISDDYGVYMLFFPWHLHRKMCIWVFNTYRKVLNIKIREMQFSFCF